MSKETKEKFESQWHEVFAVGTHTANDGTVVTVNEEHLDRIATVYNSQSAYEAPVVIGHPKIDAPAYGWVEKLKAEGGKLYAKFRDVADEFADLVKAGRYKKKSIKLLGDQLIHVGFLGAVPPAVPGLKNAVFSTSDGKTFEFSCENGFTLRRFMQSVRDFLIDKFDIETADRIVPTWEINSVNTEETPNFYSSPSGGNMPTEKELQSQIDQLTSKLAASESKNHEFSTQIANLTQENATLKSSVTEMSTAIQSLQKSIQDKEFSEFVDGLIKEGKVLPAERDAALVCMSSLAGSGEVEFSGGVKKSRLDVYKEQLSSRPAVVQFGHAATKDKATGTGAEAATEFSGMNVDPAQMEVHTKAVELSKSEKIPYRDAVQRVING